MPTTLRGSQRRTDPSAPSPAPPRPLTQRSALAALLLAVLAYFFWTTVLSFDPVPGIGPTTHRETDHYNLLSRGFLNGHLHLDGDPPAALLAAANPYDPKSRGPVEVLHDASLYRGKYYIYFGPAPVVTLFLPFTVLTGRDLPIPYGVLFFVSAAYLALAATFLFVQRRHFPRASLSSIVAGLIALAGASMLVALLRRPHIWEIAGAAGLAYFSLALYCLVRAIHSPRPARWTALGGLALGLAVAARPTWIVCSLLFALPLLLRPRDRLAAAADPYTFRALLAAAATCTALVAGLLAYNYARFENPFEFGQKYQLSAVIEGEQRHFSLSYVAWNFRTYFLTAFNWLPHFPFANGVTLTPSPSGHGGYEYSFGFFPNLPFSLFALLIPAALLRRRCRDLEDKRKRAVLSVFAAAAFLSTGLLLTFFGNCVRYMADFGPWLMLLAACAILAVDTRLSSVFARRLFRPAVLLLALGSSLVAALGVVGVYHFTERPLAGYLPVARVLNYPGFAFRLLRYSDFRPQELDVTFPADRTPRQEPLLTAQRGAHSAQFFVEYLTADTLRFGYRESTSARPHFSPPVFAPARARHRLLVDVGHDYATHDGWTSRLRLQFDSFPLWDAPVVSLAAIPGRLLLAQDPATPARFTGTLHASRPITAADFAPARLGGARVRLALTPDMAGRSFPLMTSGRSDAGDLLFLKVHPDGRSTLGYDHWADPLRFSAELPTSFGRPHVFEFWMPQPSDPPPRKRGQRDLLVKLDGSTVWRERVPGFPTSPSTLHVATNPIGGSTCEPTLPNGVLEETQIPFPASP